MTGFRLSQFCCSEDKIQIIERMKQHGRYGVLYKILYDGTEHALKIPHGEVDQVAILRELEVLAEISHPAILRLIKFVYYITPDKLKRDCNEIADFETPRALAIITPLMRNGDLSNIIADELDQEETVGWNATKKSICIFGIAAGMKVIHDHNICHGDLKEENVLLDDNMEPVIADFGFSDFTSTNAVITGKRGTQLYMAPEILSGDDKGYGKEVDVYAYGVLLLKLFVPESDIKINGAPVQPKYLNEQIRAGNRFDYNENVPEYFWNLIRRCWKEAADRPTFAEIVDELHRDTDKWALPNTDLTELRAYQSKLEYL